MKIENNVQIDCKRLFDDVIEKLYPFAAVPVTVTLKNDRIDGNSNMIEPELMNVLDVRRCGECAKLLQRVVSALRKPTAYGNTMLQMLLSFPRERVVLSKG